MTSSPYEGVPVHDWDSVTERLLAEHPVTGEELRDLVAVAWDAIFASSVGLLRIGTDILPQPQVIGFFLHELIPVELAKIDSNWRRGRGSEKDAHYAPEPRFSFEIKTSSHLRDIFGNRSYAQVSEARGKEKSGYLLAVNFEKFGGDARPKITRIRFGWLDHSDWVGQKSQTGQQAHLSHEADRAKLVDLL